MNSKAVTCPKCGSHAVVSGGKPWCPQCGWNRDAAYRHLRQRQRIAYFSPLLAAPVLVALGRWWFEIPWWLMLVLWGPLVLMGPLSFRAWQREIKKLELAAPEKGLRAKPPSPSPSFPSKPSSEHSEPLDVTGSTVFYQGKEIPAGWPRSVRLPRKTKVMYGVMYSVIVWLEAVFVYLMYERWERFRESGDLPLGILMLLGMAAFVAICAWLLPRKLRRHRRLLVTGEMSLGRVSGQRIKQAGDTTENRITYRYKDKTGRILTGEDRDQTENFYEGMVIPVVYEQGNPANHLALCSTDYEVLPAYPTE